MDRTVQGLSRGIKKRHLDARTRNGRHRGLIADAKNSKPVIKNSNFKGIQAKDEWLRYFDSVLHHLAAVSLADACNAFIGADFNDRSRRARLHTQAPAQRCFHGYGDMGEFNAGNFHLLRLSSW